MHLCNEFENLSTKFGKFMRGYAVFTKKKDMGHGGASVFNRKLPQASIFKRNFSFSN